MFPVIRLKKVFTSLFFVAGMFVMNSCITDEFRLNDLQIDQGRETDITGPLLSGNLEMKDLVDWEHSAGLTGKKITLAFLDDKTMLVPVSAIYNPTVLTTNFPFSIQGNYELTSITLVFRVNNGTPLPLNLRMRFYHSSEGFQAAPAVLPETFSEGKPAGNSVIPVFSTDTLQLTEEQRQSFIGSNKIRMTTWFTDNGFLDNNDTLRSDYPVDISVVLIGKVKVKLENQ